MAKADQQISRSRHATSLAQLLRHPFHIVPGNYKATSSFLFLVVMASNLIATASTYSVVDSRSKPRIQMHSSSRLFGRKPLANCYLKIQRRAKPMPTSRDIVLCNLPRRWQPGIHPSFLRACPYNDLQCFCIMLHCVCIVMYIISVCVYYIYTLQTYTFLHVHIIETAIAPALSALLQAKKLWCREIARKLPVGNCMP